MPRKITIHCQQVPGWAGEFLRRSGAGYIKVVDGCPQFDGVQTIFRPFWKQEDVNRIVSLGNAGAMEWTAAMEPVLLTLPRGTLVEVTNEASIWDSWVLAGYAAFHSRLIRNLHALGLRIIIGGINTGHPKLLHEDGGKELAAIGKALIGTDGSLADGLSLHEYSDLKNDIMALGQALRYRDVHAGLRQLGYPEVPFFITEFGFDRWEGRHYGWKSLCDDVDVCVREYMRYEAEIQKDPYVACATIFTAGPYINPEKPWEWGDFEVTEELAMKLAEAELPARARLIDISGENGLFPWDSLPEDVVGVFMRASIGNQKDVQFDRNYAEAKKRGKLVGAYHGLIPDVPGQAAVFAAAMSGKLMELGHYGDLEKAPEKWSDFLKAADINTGNVTHIYTGPAVWGQYGSVDMARGRKLWIGHWDVPSPTIPAGWSGYEFWQYGKITINGKLIDANWYKGTVEELYQAYRPAPVPEPPEPDGPEIDSRIEELLTFDLTGSRYKLRKLAWLDEAQSAGLHHIFVEVLNKDGQRAVGTKVTVQDGGTLVGVIEAKPGEPWPYNFPMFGTLGSYTVSVGEAGESDVVHGMGMGTPEKPGYTIHTCFQLTFVEAGSQPPEPPAPPPPEPPEPPPPVPPVPPPNDFKAAVLQRLDRIITSLEKLNA